MPSHTDLNGPYGYHGANGANGYHGANETNGTNGYHGSNGFHGTNGFNETHGAQKLHGINGTNGVNGTHRVKAANGTNGSAHKAQPLYDPDFTARVIAATGPNANPRLAQIMPSLIQHLHDFAREVDLTFGEWMAGVQLINAAGQMSNDARNETQLLCDILGLESLVDEITTKQLQLSTNTGPSSTPSAILGPFYRNDAPILPNGTSIVASLHLPDYQKASTHLSGRVLDLHGDPIRDAIVDIWHTAPNGMYEQQDPDQPEMDLRGRFCTDSEGRYSLYCLRPVPYPVPDDGPAGKLLKMLDRSPYRPAHLHFIITADGYRPLTTQLFDRGDKYLKDDSVFAVKEDLIADYVPRVGDPKARWTLDYDFVLSEA